jgi:hypothetical protein
MDGQLTRFSTIMESVFMCTTLDALVKVKMKEELTVIGILHHFPAASL